MQLANFFLPLSKLWKKALFPLGRTTNLHWKVTSHFSEQSHVVFLQLCELRHLCLQGENSLLECKSRFLSSVRGFLSSLSRSSDTTSHLSSLKQSRNCRSVHPSIGISDGNKRKVSYLLLVNFQQLWKWTHKCLWLKDHWILPQAINS